MNFFPFNFSIQVKIISAVILTALILAISYYIYQNTSHKKNLYLDILQKKELIETTNSIILLKSDFLEKLVIDYACYDWMVHFISVPSFSEARENITPAAKLDLSFIQIYSLELKPVYVDFCAPLKDTIAIPGEVFSILFKNKVINFFLYTKSGLIQVVGSTVHPSSDLNRNSKPRGYFLLGKIWDVNYLNDLERLTGNKYKLTSQLNGSAFKDRNISTISLKSYEKNNTAFLQISRYNPYINQIRNLNIFFDKFFIITIIVILIMTILVFNRLVLKPLGSMIYSLDTASPEKLLNTAVRGDEFGKISRYLIEFFSQKNMLLDKLTELNHIKDYLNNLNHELHTQKEELMTSSEKLLKANEELTESIKYASIIQNAVLNIPASFSSTFSNHFVLYKPKNIVSGDFYWIYEKDGLFYIVCADCTGHGLAGSLLSMLGISFLKDVVQQQNDLKPSDILNYLRDFMVETLNQTGEFGEAHGAMDLIFCIIDPASSKLHYAGAFNSFYVITGNSETGEKQLKEYKGDAMPVGIYIKNDPFTNHTINLAQGDMIYLFSDGFIDQFGGPANKKFRSNKFKELLLSVCEMPIKVQMETIAGTFDNWQGTNEQTDDLLIMGIKYDTTSISY